jgi:nitrite reductase (NADH) small subunit
MPGGVSSTTKRGTSRHVVARVEEIPVGARKIVQVGNRSIGVFNVGGEFYALKNTCPHQQAPLCEGRVMGTTLPSRPGEYRFGLEGRVLRCPWHAWEFDITTGRSFFAPDACRVKSYQVAVEEVTVETYEAKVEGAFVVVYV